MSVILSLTLALLIITLTHSTVPPCDQFNPYEGYYYDYVSCKPCTPCLNEADVLEPCTQFTNTVCKPQNCTTMNDCKYTGCYDVDYVVAYGCNCVDNQFYNYEVKRINTQCYTPATSLNFLPNTCVYTTPSGYAIGGNVINYCPPRPNIPTNKNSVPQGMLENFAVVLDRGGTTGSPTYYRYAFLNLTSKTTQTMFQYHADEANPPITYPYVDPSAEFMYAVEGSQASRIIKVSLQRPFTKQITPIAGSLNTDDSYANGPFETARFKYLSILGGPIDSSFLVASDNGRKLLRILNFSTSTVTTLHTYAGPNWQGWQDMKVNAKGTRVYLASDFKVQYVDVYTGSLVHIAGDNIAAARNGKASVARFYYIISIAVTSDDSYVYVAHYHPLGGGWMRKINMNNLESDDAVSNLITRIPDMDVIDVNPMDISAYDDALYILYTPYNLVRGIAIDQATVTGTESTVFGQALEFSGLSDDLTPGDTMTERFAMVQYISVWKCRKPGYDCKASRYYAMPCDTGHFSLIGETCKACGDGAFTNQSNQPCQACSEGTYSRAPTSACTVCPAQTRAKSNRGPCLSNRTKQAFAIFTQVESGATRIGRLNLSDHTVETLVNIPQNQYNFYFQGICIDPSGLYAYLYQPYEIYSIMLRYPYNATRITGKWRSITEIPSLAGQYELGENAHIDGNLSSARFESIKAMKMPAVGGLLVVHDTSCVAVVNLKKRRVYTVLASASDLQAMAVFSNGTQMLYAISNTIYTLNLKTKASASMGVTLSESAYDMVITNDDSTVFITGRAPSAYDTPDNSLLYRLNLKTKTLKILDWRDAYTWGGNLVMGLQLDRMWISSARTKKISEIVVKGDTSTIVKTYYNTTQHDIFNGNPLFVSAWACRSHLYECGYDENYSEPCNFTHASDGIGKCQPCENFRLIKCDIECPANLTRINNKCYKILNGPYTFIFKLPVPDLDLVTEQWLALYEQAVAMALGISRDQVYTTLDDISAPAGVNTGRRLLSTTEPPEEIIYITFIIQVSSSQNYMNLANEIKALQFQANLNTAATQLGVQPLSIQAASLQGLNFNAYPPPPILVTPSPPAPPPAVMPDLDSAAPRRLSMRHTAFIIIIVTIILLRVIDMWFNEI